MLSVKMGISVLITGVKILKRQIQFVGLMIQVILIQPQEQVVELVNNAMATEIVSTRLMVITIAGLVVKDAFMASAKIIQPVLEPQPVANVGQMLV